MYDYLDETNPILEVEMKPNKRFFITTLVLLAAYVLSACGGLPQQADGSSGEQAAIKVRAVEVAYTGVIEAMNGDEWTVNGQVLTVDPAVIQDGPFQEGDTVKIEGEMNADGSFIVSRVEAPTASDLTDLPILGDDNANVNSNDDNSNDDMDNANDNDDNSNDDNVNGNSNEDDDDNANGNSNDDDDDDDDNANGNSNDDDDEDDDDSNSNDNSDDDDRYSSSGSNNNDSNRGGDSSSDSSDDDDHDDDHDDEDDD
jgi:hypothetical protein